MALNGSGGEFIVQAIAFVVSLIDLSLNFFSVNIHGLGCVDMRTGFDLGDVQVCYLKGECCCWSISQLDDTVGHKWTWDIYVTSGKGPCLVSAMPGRDPLHHFTRSWFLQRLLPCETAWTDLVSLEKARCPFPKLFPEITCISCNAALSLLWLAWRAVITCNPRLNPKSPRDAVATQWFKTP